MVAHVLDDASIERALAMREAGMTDRAIAAELGTSARTISRALGPRRQWQRGMQRRTGRSGKRHGKRWPADREWPADQDVEYLVSKAGFDREHAEHAMFVVQAARNRGNVWVPWFMHLGVGINVDELAKPDAERLPDDAAGVAWRDALAGLRVLAKWLPCAEAGQLADLIREAQPYTLGIPRRSVNVPKLIWRTAKGVRRLVEARPSYAKASTPFVKAIQRRVEALAYDMALAVPIEFPAENGSGPYAALAELLRRLPMVDTAKVVGKSRGHPHGLWQVFIGIFRFDPPTGGE